MRRRSTGLLIERSMPDVANERVIIVGGGIVGLTTAHSLLKRGLDVLVLDAGPDHVTPSRGNAGQIAPGHPPIPSPAVPPQALHMLLDRRSPLFIPPRPSLPLARWLLSFRLACRGSHYHHAMRILGGMSALSRDGFDALIEDLGPESTLAASGIADFWRTAKGEAEAEEETAWMDALGFATTMLTGEELRAADPVWGPDVRGAVVHKAGMTVEPAHVCDALRRSIRSLGGDLLQGRTAASLRRTGGVWNIRTVQGEVHEANTVVIAAGVWSAPLARQVGAVVHMQPAKGYHTMLTMSRPPRMAGVLREAKIAVTPLNGQVRLAGTLELSGFNHRLDRGRIRQLLRGAAVFLPEASDAHADQPWCGLRPCTASGMPVVGQAAPNAWIATGHGMMGLTLATGTASILTAAILGESTPEWSAALRPRCR